jgi:hypothetical protein
MNIVILNEFYGTCALRKIIFGINMSGSPGPFHERHDHELRTKQQMPSSQCQSPRQGKEEEITFQKEDFQPDLVDRRMPVSFMQV